MRAAVRGGGLARTLPELRDLVAAAGRDPDLLHIAPMAVEPTADKLEYYESIGVTEVGMRLPTGPRDDVLRTLDAYTALLV